MLDSLKAILHVLLNLKSGGYTYLAKLTGVQVGVDSAAYASGDVLGDKCPIKIELVRGNNETAIVQSIITQDLSNQGGAYDVIFFDSNPSATTFTDNAPLDIADADLPKVIGHVSIGATDYATFSDNQVATTKGIGLPIQNRTGEPYIWIALVSRDTKTYVADELSIAIGLLQD